MSIQCLLPLTFVSVQLSSIKSFARAEYPLEIKHPIRLSNCPTVFKIYRCFPDADGNIDNTCDGVVPDAFRECRRLEYFPAKSQIKIISIHDREGNDVTSDMDLPLKDPSQYFLGIVSEQTGDIAYTPLINIYANGRKKPLFKDTKSKLASLQRNLQEERRSLGLNENGQTRREANPAPIITSHGTDHSAGNCPCHNRKDLKSTVSRIRDIISTKGFEYESCHKKNNYLENSLTKDPTAIKESFDEDLSPICTYAALKYEVNGHRHCINGKSYYRKTTPCLSEKYHKSVHNSLLLVSKCTQIDKKVLFDLFNTESSLHVNVRSSFLRDWSLPTHYKYLFKM